MNEIKVTRGLPCEEDRYLDFLHYSFGFNGTTNNLVSLLPKVYKSQKSALSSWIVRDGDGYILSAVGAYPADFSVGNTVLHGMGIGNVATHPRYRGCGYMKACMQASLDEMIEKDIDFGFLGGRRHRYRNFGYEKCSADMNFTVTQKIMSYFPHCEAPIIRMTEVNQGDDKILDDIYEAHSARPYHAVRPREAIFDIMTSWYSTILAFHKDDTLVGWAVSQKRDYISEIVILDTDYTENILYNIVRRNGTQRLVVPRFEKTLCAALSRYAEQSVMTSDACFMILNYERVIRAALELKASCEALPNCDFTVKIEGIKKTENLHVRVKDGQTSVCPVASEPDYSLSHLDAQEFFFLGYTPIRDNLPLELRALLPLDLFLSHVDNV